MRIACHRDSLTAGYFLGEDLYPPSRTLQARCDAAFDAGALLARNFGVSGAPLCTAETLEGFGLDTFDLPDCIPQRIAALASPADFIVLLGGTNDVGMLAASPPAPAAAALLSGHAAMVAAELATLAPAATAPARRALVLTVPESFCTDAAYTALRGALNAHIRAQAASGAYAVLDLEQLMPFDPAGGHWSSDGLHLSEAGYAAVGDLIFEALSPVIAELRSAGAAAGAGSS